MKKMFFCLLGAAALLAACSSKPAAVDLTGLTSYYVRADGNDKNPGTSEAAPFKTLARAVEAAAKTSVKKITVIGTLVENVVINETDSMDNRPQKIIDATGGQDIAKALTGLGLATITWSLDEHDPDEILITGKPGASGPERAVLTPADQNDVTLGLTYSNLRLEHIEISGVNTTKNLPAVVVAGTLTLAKGAKITNNTNGGGIYAIGGVVIMRDDAEVSHNQGNDNVGVYLELGSVMVMFDTSHITGNKAVAGNGGGLALSGSSLIMRDNSSITANSAGNAGGGIITFTDTKNGYLSQITLYDEAAISGNSAKLGGGIFLQDKMVMEGNATITGNTATQEGGGVFGVTDNMKISIQKLDAIQGNTAPEFPDHNFDFE
ncbi:MAG: hypothetical protein LBU25_09330 [Treponema sp.]|nr:hypothetical protein [Treponema sp.]